MKKEDQKNRNKIKDLENNKEQLLQQIKELKN